MDKIGVAISALKEIIRLETPCENCPWCRADGPEDEREPCPVFVAKEALKLLSE